MGRQRNNIWAPTRAVSALHEIWIPSWAILALHEAWSPTGAISALRDVAHNSKYRDMTFFRQPLTWAASRYPRSVQRHPSNRLIRWFLTIKSSSSSTTDDNNQQPIKDVFNKYKTPYLEHIEINHLTIIPQQHYEVLSTRTPVGVYEHFIEGKIIII